MNKITAENYDEAFNEIHAKLKECVYSASDTLVKAIQDALCMAIIDSESFDEASRNDILEKIRNFNVGADYVSTAESRDYSKILLIFYVLYATYKGVIYLQPNQRQELSNKYFGCDILEYVEDYINIEALSQENKEQRDTEPIEVNISVTNETEYDSKDEASEEDYEDLEGVGYEGSDYVEGTDEDLDDPDAYETDDIDDLDDPDAYETND